LPDRQTATAPRPWLSFATTTQAPLSVLQVIEKFVVTLVPVGRFDGERLLQDCTGLDRKLMQGRFDLDGLRFQFLQLLQ
jgi:hypothetical protein